MGSVDFTGGFYRFNRFKGFNGEGSGFAANIYGAMPEGGIQVTSH